MNLERLRSEISKKMESGALPPRILQSRFKIWTEKPTALYGDPTYMPFYYYLGKSLNNTKNLIEFGFNLGMPSGCFLDACPGVEYFLAFRKKGEFNAKRMGVANIHNIWKKRFDLFVGDESNAEFIKKVLSKRWDLAIISDEFQDKKTYTAYLDLVWGQMSDTGLIVLDYLKNPEVYESYKLFCKIQSREMFTIPTVRGTAIIQKG